MLVTKIERQKRHPHRVNLYLDNEFAFGIHDTVLVKARIATGDQLTEETINTIQAMEEMNLATERALRLLSYRLRSEKELRTKLFEKEFTPTVIDNVIEHLRTTGMIDDATFARAYVHDQQLRKPAGRRLLQHQLLRKGVARHIADSVLDEQLPTDEEQTAALAAAQKIIKRHRIKSTDPEKQRHQLAQYLMRRGFAWATIAPVLKTVLSPQQSTLEE